MTKQERMNRAMAWMVRGYIGLDQANELDETIEMYPEEFPWHVKYNSFPDSVHEAYSKEREEIISINKLEYKPIYKEPETKGQGIITLLNEEREPTEEGKRWQNLSIVEQLEETFERQNKELSCACKTWKQLKKLWKKHYPNLAYGDNYREDLFGRNYNF